MHDCWLAINNVPANYEVPENDDDGDVDPEDPSEADAHPRLEIQDGKAMPTLSKAATRAAKGMATAFGPEASYAAGVVDNVLSVISFSSCVEMVSYAKQQVISQKHRPPRLMCKSVIDLRVVSRSKSLSFFQFNARRAIILIIIIIIGFIDIIIVNIIIGLW